MQLATLITCNAVAFSEVPPAPEQSARRSAASAPLALQNEISASARPSASSNSPLSLTNKLAAIVSRDDSYRPPAAAGEASFIAV